MQSPLQSTAPSATASVLLLGGEFAEWCDERGHARVPIRGRTPSELASAAAEAVQALGSRPGRCLLALGTGLIEQRTLTLPELKRSELSNIFLRKAAALLEAPLEDTLYAALPQMPDPGNTVGQTNERRWYVVAARRKQIVDLRLELRARGFDVRKVVAARLARLCQADLTRGESESAAIVIDVELDGVTVSLIAERTLVQQNRMQGSFETLPSMAFSLLQEVKSFEAFWRKLSRGGSIAHVVVIGIEPELSPLFGNALAQAMPQSRLHLLPQPAAGEAEIANANGARALGRVAGRIAALRACTADGPFNADLTVDIPARYGYAASLAACLLLVAGGLGMLLRGHLSGRLEQLDQRTESFNASAVELETLREENERTAQLAADLELECERLIRAGQVGMPLDQALADCLDALDERALLTNFSSEYEDGEGEIRIGGLTDPRPVVAMHALTDIARSLEHSASFAAVTMDAPAQRSDDVRGARTPLTFEARASWELAP